MRTLLRKNGFTLIELLLVIAIIMVLASIIIIAINPTKHLQEAENSRRIKHVRELKIGLEQYFIDSETPLTMITNVPQPICTYTAVDTNNCVNLNMLVDLNYITVYQQDVDETDPNFLGYTVYRDSRGFFIVESLHMEQTIK